MSKTLVIIIGPHAVGKMTVGQELAKITGMRLFHNHISIELALKLFDYGTPEWRELNGTIREKVFELFANSDHAGLIFTYMCDFDDHYDISYIVDLLSLFKSGGACCHVVELCADFEVRLERNKSENRLANKESKRNLERSETELRKSSAKHRLNSYEGEKLPFESYIKIDNTDLSPTLVAKMIKEKFKLS